MARARRRYLSSSASGWYNSVDVHYSQPVGTDAPPPLRPVLLFVGGGGWQGVDHVNWHDELASKWVGLGYVVVVVRHRPAALCVGGCLGLAFLLLLGLHVCFSLSMGAALVWLVGVLAASLAFNYVRGAVPLAAVVHDCAAAVAFVYHQLDCSSFGGDRDCLVACGNSSGGHLLSLLAFDRRWLTRLAVPHQSVAAVVDVSGVLALDQLPLKWLVMPLMLGFDPTAWRELSPLYVASDRKPASDCRYILATAQLEIPAIRASSNRLAKALATHSCKVTSVVLGEEKREGRFSSTHFTGVHWLSPVLSSLADELRATQLQRQAVDPIHSLTASNEKFDEGQGVGGSGRGEKEDFCCVGSGLASCELVPMHTADAIFLLSGFTVGAVMRLEAPVSERELIEIAGACADSAEVMHASPVRFGGLCYWAPHFCRDLRLHVSTRKVDGGEGGEVEHGEAMDRSGKVDQRLGAESESRPKDEIKERVGGTGEDGERERGGEGRGRAGESLEGMDRLDAAIEREVQRPLASDQPMWRLTQLTYDPPLPSARGGGLGRAALVLTFHHCMGDGAWLNALLHQATSRRLRSQSVSAPMQGEGAGGASGAVGREAQSAPRRAGSVCGAVLYNSWAWTLQLAALARCACLPLGHNTSPFLSRSRVTLTSCPELHNARSHSLFGGEKPTLTDVMLSALAGCIRASLHDKGALPPRRLLGFMPVMQPHGKASAKLQSHKGNAVSGYFIEIPTHLSSPTERLLDVFRQTSPYRRWRVACFHALLIRAAMPLLPLPLLPPLVRAASSFFSAIGISCFRGPAGGSILGLDVRAFYYFGFFDPQRMPLMLGISSVGDRMVVSLVSICDELEAGGGELLEKLPEELRCLDREARSQ